MRNYFLTNYSTGGTLIWSGESSLFNGHCAKVS
jgi:hypothetical protein